jgi:hypothetical protein
MDPATGVEYGLTARYLKFDRLPRLHHFLHVGGMAF